MFLRLRRALLATDASRGLVCDADRQRLCVDERLRDQFQFGLGSSPRGQLHR
jgi:hypothetical protein